ncbi:glycosyltransferase [Mucilaginibacter terrae]|uniref:Cellulose synthase (UDP-forming) n=1 Tax=Mucilaginibacter terrae TaxID=1955052 RepID=A0ABU3GNU7_9SPHI|nr:glycosyltransferase [Mucilaginibacter terrae]MDT3401463.1 cellulose synthase (UDP-forming) [Mucilaginibacter terrae]
MKIPESIKQPTHGQRLVLRIMIVIGLFSVFFLLQALFRAGAKGEPHLYWTLMAAFAFTCFKVLYEWYHYWSITVPDEVPEKRKYTVDIFTTFCAGEPYEMIVETLTAIQNITYPHEAYLCDEANDSYLRQVCEQLGIHHLTRTLKINAKAGNINNALGLSKSELCVVLDPDHVPKPDFLNHVVNHFNDESIGFVQVVQAYSNYHLGWVAKGAAQQTYQFYGPMMMTMNVYGTVQAIGANCTFRRTALESIGGHAAGLAEDMHTAMQLHAKGWQSVYVPVVVTEGLVPATLSAYYKQQLKWSRGVFELLFTSYIKLFFKFTWRQKLHYGLLPLFYLSGFVFLINFIVPIVSLFTGTYPLRIDFSDFLLVSVPFAASMICIRHYVQRWVMQDNERGFHMVGGFLLIITWWVFIVGFVYTLIRKKVPYIPTPKDISEEKNLLILLPNIAVYIFSVAAIFYGLYTDLNPYNLIMAGMAMVNCWFMVFSWMCSQQFVFREYRQTRPKLNAVVNQIGALKTWFWFLRRRLYSGVRSIAFMLVVITACVCSFELKKLPVYDNVGIQAVRQKPVFLTGIFAPDGTNGITSVSKVNQLQSAAKVHFNLISMYVAWGDSSRCLPSRQAMDSIYSNRSIPIITWEPWQVLFSNKVNKKKDTKVFANITSGGYDAYLTKFALSLKATRQPVFLRFAHEADNPFYPWSARGENTPAEFKAAWKYVHQYFDRLGVYNVFWVWNPWKAQNAQRYFPGNDFVDWVGITGLNFGSFNDDKKSYSFAQLYSPFHKLGLMKYKLPVIIAEFGSLQQNGSQRQWLTQARRDIKTQFKEVQGLVLFNTAFDKNTPDGSPVTLNWQVKDAGGIKQAFQNNTNLPVTPTAASLPAPVANKPLGDIKGVIYAKRKYWYKNPFPLTKKVIEDDFKGMADIGVNTIKVLGPNPYYDRSTFEVAEETRMSIMYSFWLPDANEFIADSTVLDELKKTIIACIHKNKSKHVIKSWNLANTPLQQLKAFYVQPQLFIKQGKHIQWLSGLVEAIKKEDPSRPVTIDVAADRALLPLTIRLHELVPQIDGFGLRVNNEIDIAAISRLQVPYYFSYIRPQQYLKAIKLNKGAIVGKWQDQQTETGIDFDGLNDMWGRHKPELVTLSQLWHGRFKPVNMPPIKILRPAATTHAGAVLPYRALIYQDSNWLLAGRNFTSISFEWRLLKIDTNGKVIDMTTVGNGSTLKLIIPAEAKNYRLSLTAVKGNNEVVAFSTLNLPL